MNPIKLKIRIIFIVAILVTFTSQFGVPSEWKPNLTILFGLILLTTTYLLHRDLAIALRKTAPKKEMVTESFRENGFTHQSEPQR